MAAEFIAGLKGFTQLAMSTSETVGCLWDETERHSILMIHPILQVIWNFWQRHGTNSNLINATIHQELAEMCDKWVVDVMVVNFNVNLLISRAQRK